MKYRTAFLSLHCLLCTFHSCLAKDFLNVGENITGTTSVLSSAKNKFVLGFFSPPGSPTRSYLGIWYNQSQYPGPQTVIWVANRDNPISNPNVGVFRIANDGRITVTDTSGSGQTCYWSSRNEASTSRNRTVKLFDSGNLVLMMVLDEAIIYQSFLHPTDTFLAGMKMDSEVKLTSWSSDDNPRTGSFTFQIAGDGDDYSYKYKYNPSYAILKNWQRYWESGKHLDSDFDAIISYMLTNFSTGTNTSDNFDNTMLVMKNTGELKLLVWDSFGHDWLVRWKAPASPCDQYNFCGHFTSCNGNNFKPCNCLPGFKRAEVSDENNGCVRRTATEESCGGGGGEGRSAFLELVKVKPGIPDGKYPAENESECKERCLQNCSHCQAYSYVEADVNGYRCWIWTQELDTVQDVEDDHLRNLFVRLDKSDIEPTTRTCEPCGINTVPYPLSTGPNCGDPNYFNFSCNRSTSQLTFITKTSTSGTTIHHKVTSMDVESKKFVIQVDPSVTYCTYETFSSDESLHIGSPFSVTNDCLDEDEIEVTWEPPHEPICTHSQNCEGWNHSTCKATRNGMRCICDVNYRWDGDSLTCKQVPSKGNSRGKTYLILGITLTSVITLACAIIFAYLCNRKRKEDKKSNKRNRGRLFDNEKDVKDLIEEEGLEEEDNEGIEVPYFDFESILEATDNFSDANKLGRGGYGPVYKGKLQNGEVVAIKRLSSISSQGLHEFKNEVVLIAKLQHRNLVRLRGYCIRGQEKILIYEYMRHKSLDLIIFDPTQSGFLNWQIRFDIIVGIARGMLYLHQDSRLRVIHRDLKTSNILLDEEMKPKISDFGLAKIVTNKDIETDTKRVVGTYGYMSPEYARDGRCSTKSDVFSFGVIILEIISGKKNTKFSQYDEYLSLLDYAWTLWTQNKLLELMDKSLGESCNANQFIRCAHIGLLCVQDDPGDRPTMSNVVTLLDSETATIPTPKQPTFFGGRRALSTTTSSSKPETTSSRPEITSIQFDSTSSILEGR